MKRVLKSIMAVAAFAAVAGGCATYDYGYSQPYAYSYGYGSGPYYDPYYDPYYYSPYYYGPGYYVGPPVLGFYYYDSHGGRHWSGRHDRGHDGRWSGNRDRGHDGRWSDNRGRDRDGRGPTVGRNDRPADSRPAPAFTQGRDRAISPEAAARAEQHG